MIFIFVIKILMFNIFFKYKFIFYCLIYYIFLKQFLVDTLTKPSSPFDFLLLYATWSNIFLIWCLLIQNFGRNISLCLTWGRNGLEDNINMYSHNVNLYFFSFWRSTDFNALNIFFLLTAYMTGLLCMYLIISKAIILTK